jgi:glycosyltransferase involved in cell wall biosynthesis
MTSIVISAVNCVEGGTLKIFQESVSQAARCLPGWRIIVLAHDRALIDTPGVEILEFPAAKRRWLSRLYHEWWCFSRLAREIRPQIWLSMHDITARVSGCRHFVYCHNPMPFYRLRWREGLREPVIILQNKLYALVYRAFLKRNSGVIVQQEWMRQRFYRLGASRVTVAHPVADRAAPADMSCPGRSNIFLFPSLPRAFKNFETLCEAAKALAAMPEWQGRILITVRGNENRYARWLHRRYADVPRLHFIGRQSRTEMDQRYSEADCVVFPSRLETWGLPITEAKERRLPLLVANAEYAAETVGDYDYVSFFEKDDPAELAKLILHAHLHGWAPRPVRSPRPADPFASGWRELFTIITTTDQDAKPHSVARELEGSVA